MPSLVDFLHRLLFEGTVVFRERPSPSIGHRREAIDLLERAYADDRLDVAGPPIEFHAETAVAAAELVRQACWFLVNHAEPEAELERHLALAPPRNEAARHLSADLTLRFLPQVYHRARALAPADRLVARLAQLLRQWPLTGVLSEVEEEPLTPLDFGGHSGLMLLYAERLARNPKPAWVPEGPAREHVELVFHELGQEPLAPPRNAVEPAAGARQEGGDVRD